MPSPRPRVVVRGKFPTVYMPGEYKDWKAGVATHVQGLSTITPAAPGEPVKVELQFFCERPKTTKLSHPKPDIDNYAKSVLDAFNDSGVIWDDDTQVIDLWATKAWAQPGEAPRVVCKLTIG